MKLDISALKQRSNRFVDNINLFKAQAVENSKDTLVDLNRSQMLQSKTANDTQITPEYTPKYAAFKGFNFPNLKLTGDFQEEMDVTVNENTSEYFITSFDFKTPFLTERYDNIFGIAPSNNAKATEETSKNFLTLYNINVLQG